MDIHEKKNKEIKKVTEDHANIFNNMKNYYSELNKKNLNTLKNLTSHFSSELKLLKANKDKKLALLKKKKKIEMAKPGKVQYFTAISSGETGGMKPKKKGKKKAG